MLNAQLANSAALLEGCHHKLLDESKIPLQRHPESYWSKSFRMTLGGRAISPGLNPNYTIIAHKVPFLAIVHAGRTSIPDMPAKLILDVDVVISSSTPANLQAAISTLTSATGNYTYRGKIDIPHRHAFEFRDLTANRNGTCICALPGVRH